jgi:tagaturonate epimerase
MLRLPRNSIGIGDRFAHQGCAQLDALIAAEGKGVEITPVWNKSFREHSIIGTQPQSVRDEADSAVRQKGWKRPYFVDADHINLKIVDGFLDCSDFFTLDVADYIGLPPDPADLDAFVARHKDLTVVRAIPGIPDPLTIDESSLRRIAGKYLVAVREAGKIYRRIEQTKGPGRFVTEVSMDESNEPQTPVDLLVILAALADEGIPAQTIAPKFTGRFNKGVDYVGDRDLFERQFRDDLAVIRFAAPRLGLPDTLKLSVHSGSDKFSLYPVIRRALLDFDAGLHLKTAGTTWLEELIGLAMAGGDGLQIAKDVYVAAIVRFDELCGPYATVIDIDKSRLPDPRTVANWTGEQFAAALRHDPACPAFNPHLRQLLHVGYKIATEMGPRFLSALDAHQAVIAAQVTSNLLDRHIRRLWLN